MSPPASQPVAQGTLDRYPLPKLLFFLYRKRLTGSLTLAVAGEPNTIIYFRDGTPVMALLPQGAEFLGRILLETNVITQDAYDEALRAMASSGRRQGEILRDMGAIDEEQLTQALKRQLRRKLSSLFGLTAGAFEIFASDHQYGRAEEAAQMRVHPRRIIYEGIRHRYDDRRLAAEAPGLERQPMRLKVDAARALDRYGFDEQDLRLVARLSERPWTLAELVAATGCDHTVAWMILYALEVTEVLDVGPAATAPDAARTPAPATQPALTVPAAVLAPQPAAPPVRPPAPPPAARPAARPAASPPSARAPASSAPAPAAPAPLRPAAARPPGGGLPPAARDKLREQIESRAKDLDKQSLFQVLGLAPSATKEAIRAAYLELAKIFHPDRLHGTGLESLRPLVEGIFARVSEAHATLMDDDKRRNYAQSLTMGGDLSRGQKILEAELSFQKGTVLLRRKDFTGAILELKRAVTLNADEGEHYAALAWAMWQAAADKNAVVGETRAMLAEAHKLAPRCVRVHFYRAEIAMARGEEEEALAAYRKVLGIDENHVDSQRAVRLLTNRLEKKQTKGGFFDRFKRK
jgi:tetratricopeptide (TPR) repeat protein